MGSSVERTSIPLLNQSAIACLEELAPGGVYTNVDLAAVSRWRIGGRAACIVVPASAKQAGDVIAFLHQAGMPSVILGSSSNLLFSDEGLNAVGIHIGRRMGAMVINGSRVYCEAGRYVPAFARRLAAAGLAGGEHVAGIPGTLGGLICMNGGSQRRGIGENVLAVEVIDKMGRRKTYATDQCGFAYRTSIFQNAGDAILGAEFSFSTTDSPAAIRRRMMLILAERRAKFPQKEPNCGSVFVSDPAMYEEFGPPGAIIERLGLKGKRVGDAEISTHHANFIINRGRAQASDVLALVRAVRDRVKQETGYTMRAEGKLVMPNGHVVPLK